MGGVLGAGLGAITAKCTSPEAPSGWECASGNPKFNIWNGKLSEGTGIISIGSEVVKSGTNVGGAAQYSLQFSRKAIESGALGEAAKSSTKLLNQFNSVESLIQGAGKFSRVKGAQQAFIKGDGASIFKAISQGGTRQANGTILMKDGTTLFNHFSTKTGVYTIDINRAGQVFKIRVTP